MNIFYENPQLYSSYFSLDQISNGQLKFVNQINVFNFIIGFCIWWYRYLL